MGETGAQSHPIGSGSINLRGREIRDGNTCDFHPAVGRLLNGTKLLHWVLPSRTPYMNTKQAEAKIRFRRTKTQNGTREKKALHKSVHLHRPLLTTGRKDENHLLCKFSVDHIAFPFPSFPLCTAIAFSCKGKNFPQRKP